MVDYKSIMSALKRVNASGPDMFVVNIGARMTSQGHDEDHAWNLVLRTFPKRNVSTLAIEADAHEFSSLQRRFASPKYKAHANRVQLLNQRISSTNIVRAFTEHGVPRVFHLLKIDIDSIELPVVRAIVRGGFRPILILGEYNQWTPLPIEFVALEPGQDAKLSPMYGAGFSGFNHHWPCAGASLASWHRLASELGYRVLQLDSPPAQANVLLVRKESGSNFKHWSTDLWCHAGVFYNWSFARLIPEVTLHRRVNRREIRERASRMPFKLVHGHWEPDAAFDLAPAAEVIAKSCSSAQTPYQLCIQEHCCPRNATNSLLCQVNTLAE